MALAVLAAARVTFDGLSPQVSYRQPALWMADVTLLVTQRGFPWGRSIVSEVVPVESATSTPTESPSYVPRFPDANRFTMLASLYAQLAVSDPVQTLMLREGPLKGEIDAQALVTHEGGWFLPLVRITAVSTSPAEATRLASRTSRAFHAYLERQQETAGIPRDERVQVPVVRRAAEATVFSGRSLVKPIFVFLLVSMMTVGLAFLLQNLRPGETMRNRLRLAK